MEREHWSELSEAISQVEQRFPVNQRDAYPTARIVRVYVWAVIHNAAVRWACKPQNWDHATRPAELPTQSTMSRRLRRDDCAQFLQKIERALAGRPVGLQLVKRLDGKPLSIPAHSTDPDAGWGRGAGQKANGYKLHVIWAGRPMPEAWRIAPLNVSEHEMARRMLRDLDGAGYVLADKNYDSNQLFDQAARRQHQLLCPRRYGHRRGLGHRQQSSHRLRCKDLLEGPTATLTGFGRELWRQRRQVERDFAHAGSFTGGLQALPPWVRRYPRVRLWVWAKLIINAARIRCLQARSTDVAA